jgi:nucleoside diphosphate kinase
MKVSHPEQSLVFVKYDFVDIADEIFEYTDSLIKIYFHGTSPSFIQPVPREIMRKHYKHVSGFSFFREMIEGFYNHGLVLRVYTGQGIVNELIRIIGPTDPSQGEIWQVRRHFSKDVLERALAQSRAVRNVIHRSDSLEEACTELIRFRAFL